MGLLMLGVRFTKEIDGPSEKTGWSFRRSGTQSRCHCHQFLTGSLSLRRCHDCLQLKYESAPQVVPGVVPKNTAADWTIRGNCMRCSHDSPHVPSPEFDPLVVGNLWIRSQACRRPGGWLGPVQEITAITGGMPKSIPATAKAE